MLRIVVKWVSIALTILLAVFVISLVVTFITASGAIQKVDEVVGTSDASQIAAATNDMAASTQGFLFSIGKAIPVVGNFFAALEQQAMNLQQGVANIGASTGNLVGSLTGAATSAFNSIGEAAGNLTQALPQ